MMPRKTNPPRGATGKPTAQGRYRLGLLPFGPDPVHGRPLHRPRPRLAAGGVRAILRHEGAPFQPTLPDLQFRCCPVPDGVVVDVADVVGGAARISLG